jgi:hypothetical protein
MSVKRATAVKLAVPRRVGVKVIENGDCWAESDRTSVGSWTTCINNTAEIVLVGDVAVMLIGELTVIVEPDDGVKLRFEASTGV